MKYKNRKAGTKLLAIWWFFVLVIITIGIVLGVSFFRADRIDAREAESAVIVNKVINCIVLNGYFQEDLLNKAVFFEKCSFDKSIIDSSSSYFIKIYEMNMTSNAIINATSFGNNAFEEECKIRNSLTAKKFPICIERSVFVLNKNNEMIKLNIIAGSNYEFDGK